MIRLGVPVAAVRRLRRKALAAAGLDLGTKVPVFICSLVKGKQHCSPEPKD